MGENIIPPMNMIPPGEHIIPPMVMIPPTQNRLSVSEYAATAPKRVQPFLNRLPNRAALATFSKRPKQRASSKNVIISVIVRMCHGFDDDHDDYLTMIMVMATTMSMDMFRMTSMTITTDED